MLAPLRVLMVEDSPDDADLVARELRRHNYRVTFERVQNRDDMRAALGREPWELIIADYAMPSFDALGALEVLGNAGLDIPFIIVSGSIGEDTAVGAMKAGAHDYLLKQHLTRLGAAVTRELREAEVRRERKRAREKLRLLAEAGALLSDSLDYEKTLSNIIALVVPRVADWCAVDLIAEDGSIHEVAAGHADPERVRLAEELRREHPPRRGDSWGAGKVIRTGQPEIIDDFAHVNSAELEPASRETARRLDLHSSMCLPLITRRSTIGAITFGVSRGGPGRPSDLEAVRELALRFAAAIDNGRLYRDAQTAIRLRDDFLAVASHELRTPLTTLTLHIDSALRSLGAEGQAPSASLESKIARAGTQCQRLCSLVDMLFEASGIGQLRLDLDEFDLAEAAKELVSRFEISLQKAGCTLRLELRSPVRGCWDKARLEQVMTNLLSNAIKFGAGKPIEITVAREEQSARLTVRDHGIGFQPEDKERIFERLERAVNTRNYGGLGLGLYIARRIVEAHGGSITAASEVGAGTSFSVALPLTRTASKRELQ